MLCTDTLCVWNGLPVSSAGFFCSQRLLVRESLSLARKGRAPTSIQSGRKSNPLETPLTAHRGFMWRPLSSGWLLPGPGKIFHRTPGPLTKFTSKYTCPHCFHMKEAIYQKPDCALGLLCALPSTHGSEAGSLLVLHPGFLLL